VYADDGHTVVEIVILLGVGRQTIYRAHESEAVAD
jgi:Helix-turn-helix domain of resolvase